MPVSPARLAAFRILLRVEQTRSFADELLRAAALEDRDAALAAELVLGVLRRQAELDAWIAALTNRDPAQLDLEVRLALRLGLYQIRRLDRVPARTAVNESVELVKRARKASAAALVNAVLRKATQSPLPPADDPSLALPAWLLDRWRRRYGPRAETLALASLRTPDTYIRLNPCFPPPETARLLAAEGVEVEPAGEPLAFRVRRGNVSRTRCWAERRVRIQDLGSQRIVPLLDLAPPHTFLDLCAAPGGKTLQALERRPRLAVACDLHHHRLLQVEAPNRVVLDAAAPLPFRQPFDRILVDAPCSGTGTLARHPEIKWRLRPDDLEDLAARQKAILHSALAALAPEGRLVYATCSLEPEENQDVTASAGPAFRIVEERLWLPDQDPGDGFYACVLMRR